VLQGKKAQYSLHPTEFLCGLQNVQKNIYLNNLQFGRYKNKLVLADFEFLWQMGIKPGTFKID